MEFIIYMMLVPCVVSGPFSHVILVRLQDENPCLTESVGIVNVDWWPACIRGAFLLGFTSLGKSLGGLRRMSLRLTIGGYFVVLLCVFFLLGSEPSA